MHAATDDASALRWEGQRFDDERRMGRVPKGRKRYDRNDRRTVTTPANDERTPDLLIILRPRSKPIERRHIRTHDDEP